MLREKGSSESHSRTQNRYKSYFFRVVGAFWSWFRGLFIPDCYSRWYLGPSFWTGDRKEQDKEWYRQGIHALVSRRRKAVEGGGDFLEEKDLEANLLTWVCIIFMTCNTYLLWKKHGALLSEQPSHFILQNRVSMIHYLCLSVLWFFDGRYFHTHATSLSDRLFALYDTGRTSVKGSSCNML
jgi:hypothetical protein